jgi:hypothetical protein
VLALKALDFRMSAARHYYQAQDFCQPQRMAPLPLVDLCNRKRGPLYLVKLIFPAAALRPEIRLAQRL